MAITQAMTTNFKAEILLGVHDFRLSTGDTFKLALYTSSATINANTAAYTATGEVSGPGYIAGGAALINLGVSQTNTSISTGTGLTDFEDLTFANSTITARGAMIYNVTPSANGVDGNPLTNPAVCVLDFGSDKISTNGDFSIIFPAPNASSAIIRIS